jgi:hypothetical protein
MGKLSERQLADILQLQAQAGRHLPFGTLLVERGLVSAIDLDDVLRCQAEEILLRVLTWTDGTFAFTPAASDRESVPLPEINIDRIILDSIRFADEWEIIRAHIPTLDCGVELRNGTRLLPENHFSLKESIVLASVARGAATLREVAKATGMGEVELLRLVHGLAARKVLVIGRPAGEQGGARKRGRRGRRTGRSKTTAATSAA